MSGAAASAARTRRRLNRMFCIRQSMCQRGGPLTRARLCAASSARRAPVLPRLHAGAVQIRDAGDGCAVDLARELMFHRAAAQVSSEVERELLARKLHVVELH